MDYDILKAAARENALMIGALLAMTAGIFGFLLLCKWLFASETVAIVVYLVVVFSALFVGATWHSYRSRVQRERERKQREEDRRRREEERERHQADIR